MQSPDIKTWRPDILRCTDYLNPGPAERLAATLDKNSENLKEGTILPELWHWLYFLPADRQSDLSVDGHPIKGRFLPPVNLPRRMWASSQITWHSSFLLGEIIERTSRVKDILEKNGTSGKLVFVDVEHVYRSGERDVMTEVHTIVYREAASVINTSHKQKVSQAAPQEQFSRIIEPDPPLLFRYSALTFNTHRIHYDPDYVRHEEGYPGLVVHGPLTATLLVELLKNNHPCMIRNLQLRAISPLFSPEPIWLCGRIDGDVATLWATGPDNHISMKATALIY